jgi:hypothetical protein
LQQVRTRRCSSRQQDDVGTGVTIGVGGAIPVILTGDRPTRRIVEGRKSRAYIVCMAPLALVPAKLSNADLLAELARLAASEREATAALVELLAEVDARRLHLAEGCSSLFTYCTERLHRSEQAAYHRIQAARAVRAFPRILDFLRDGSVTLTAITLLAPHLTGENCERLLSAARHRSTRDVESLARSVAPMPDVRASVRKLPTTARNLTTAASTGPRSVAADATGMAAEEALERQRAALFRETAQASDESAPCAPTPARRPSTVCVLSPDRYSLRVTLSAEGHARLRRAQDLLRHTVPSGDPAAIVERALGLLVEQLERTKFAARRRDAAPPESPAATASSTSPVRAAGSAAAQPSARNSKTARTIPAAVKRAVWARDEGRCTFTGAGVRCSETGALEFHHVVTVADAGQASLENVRLLCRPHHAYESELLFGEPPGRGDPHPAPTAAATRRAPS